MKNTGHPLHILFLTYQGDIAGSTNSIAYLTKGLAERGHKIYLGCRKESLLFQMLSNSKVVLLPMTFKGKLDVENMRQIRDAVRKYDIQIINAQSSRDRYTSIFAKWFFHLNVKAIHTRRQKPESIGGFLQNWFYIKGTERILVISEELKRIFMSKGFPENHLHVIYNGMPAQRFKNIDEGKIARLRDKLGLSEQDVVIGCISRLKNQIQIIKALEFLNPKYKVLFVGIPLGYFDEIVKKLNLPHQIIYGGFIQGEEVLNYYKLLSVNVLPSTMDGFGMVLLEAMALEIPVVATNYGGIKNVIQDGVNGLLFENNDIPSLADKINQILSNSNLKQKLIKNGKKTAFETFSIQKTIDNYEDFFFSLNPIPQLGKTQ